MFGEHPGLVWLVAGIVLIGVETLAPGAFMVWIGLAAVGTGLVTLGLALSFAAEVVVFTAFAVVAIGVGLRLRRGRKASRLNTPGEGLIGRTAHALTVEGREGRVRIGDSDWSARLANGASWPDTVPDRSRPLEVIGLDGCVVVVRPRQESVATE